MEDLLDGFSPGEDSPDGVRFEPTGYLLTSDALIVPGRVVLDCAIVDDAASTAIAYLFRFRAGRVISSTSYASLDDAIEAAAACSAYSSR